MKYNNKLERSVGKDFSYQICTKHKAYTVLNEYVKRKMTKKY